MKLFKKTLILLASILMTANLWAGVGNVTSHRFRANATSTISPFNLTLNHGLGVGTASPDVGINSVGSLSFFGEEYDFNSIQPPQNPLAALSSPAAAGSVSIGGHSYRLTFVTFNGNETNAGAESNTVTIVNNAINGRIVLTTINVSLNPEVESVRIYRDKNGDLDYKLVTTIPNGQVSYTDNIADGSLGGGYPSLNQTGSLEFQGHASFSNHVKFKDVVDHYSVLTDGILASTTFSLQELNQPYLNFNSSNYGAIDLNSPHGGLDITGLTDSDKTAFNINSIVGSTTASDPAMYFSSSKADGLGGLQALADGERVLEFNNGGNKPVLDLFGSGDLYLSQGGLGIGISPTRRLDVEGVPNSDGVGTVSSVDCAVTGTGTSFTTALDVGDYIISNSVQTRITAIADATHLTVDACPAAAWVALSYKIVKPLARFIDSSNNVNARLYPTGDLHVKSIVTDSLLPNVFSIGQGAGLPQLSFGFTDSTRYHQLRTAGGANLDVMFDVLNGSTHWLGVNGLFKVGYGTVIGDSAFATAAPTNGLKVFGRVEPSMGATVASTGDLTLGADGNYFVISGNADINGIATAGWGNGSPVCLLFTGTAKLKNNTAASAGFARLFLNGSADLTESNNGVWCAFYDGTEWQESSRKVP